MKIEKSTKVTIAIVSAIILGGIGFQVWIHHKMQQVEVKTPVTQQNASPVPRRITSSRQASRKITRTPKEEVLNIEMSKAEEKSVPEEVPTAQNSDDEIRAFLAWLKSLDREDSSDETETDELNIEEKEINYAQEKKLIESVIGEQWKKGYESHDVERYMSSIWEDDFFYTSDIGTPNDPSDDVIFRGGQQERESAIRVFNTYTNIEFNLFPRSDIEFLSDTIAMVEYDYEAKFSQLLSPEGKSETLYPSGNVTIILERRENLEGIGEWRILEWYDYAHK